MILNYIDFVNLNSRISIFIIKIFTIFWQHFANMQSKEHIHFINADDCTVDERVPQKTARDTL